MRLAGKQKKKALSWGCSRERAWLSERDEKNIPENTRPHSVLLRMEIFRSCSVAAWCTGPGSPTAREGPLSTHLPHLLPALKQIYCGHVSCQLPGVFSQKSDGNNQSVSESLSWSRRQRKAWHVCVFAHVPAAGVIFHRRALSTSHEIHISHGECRTHFLHANTARVTGTGTRDSAEAHEAKVVSGSQDANGSFGRSTVTAHKLRLCSCRAHSHGCCKTLAPGLIKTLITERRGQMAA